MQSNTKKILSTVGLSSAVVLAGLAFDTTTSEASTDVSATQVKVEAGDTYKSIAESHNTSVSALEQANSREVGGFDLIFPNDIITLPEASVATNTTATTQPVSDNTQTQTATNNNTESVPVNNDSQVTTGSDNTATNQVPVQPQSQSQTTSNYNGQVLSASAGRITNSYGNTETYYNLPMNQVIANAQAQGIQGSYWVRGDGVKMYDNNVIVAANRGNYAQGSTVNTSLGQGIVLDTGTAMMSNPNQLDIATAW